MTSDDGTAIRVERLSKRYGYGAKAVQALQDVSLEVPRGQIFGLLGQNGAGKTTLIKILLDIVRPTDGRTFILGRSSRRASTRRSVGYLPEDHRFPDYRSGEGLLLFYGALSKMPLAENRERGDRLLAFVGLEAARKRKVRAFSKGMKQRLGLAQALVNDPEVVFLDEPTDGVDPVGRAHIRDLLVKLRAQGKTIFLNSHLLSEVEQVCDRVAILDKGRLLRQGTIAELTEARGLFTIRTVPEPDEDLLRAIRERSLSAEVRDGAIELGLAQEEGIDAIVDLLRARGISIRSLIAKKQTLEQVFLDVVQDRKESL